MTEPREDIATSDVNAALAVYIVHRDDSPGRVEFSRVTEEPPGNIVVTLELIQMADRSTCRVDHNELVLLNDRYRIVGWDSNLGGLVCELGSNG